MSKFEEAYRWFDVVTGRSTFNSVNHISKITQALRIAVAVEKHLPELKELDEAGVTLTRAQNEWNRIVNAGYVPAIEQSRASKEKQEAWENLSTKAANSRNVIKDILKEFEG